MRAQEIANLAWALAVMDEADVDLLKDLLRSAQAQRKDITLIESHQLYQVKWCGDLFGCMKKERLFFMYVRVFVFLKPSPEYPRW